ncbi:glucosamine-6-phosphate deaminase [Acidobacteriota bacterium]
MEIIIKNDYDEICTEAYHIIYQKWQQKNNMVLGCATGRTPLGVYAKLIDSNKKGKINFSELKVFSLDEYLGLKETHPQSFATYMNKHFYQQINIKKENIHGLKGMPEDIDEHCWVYESLIKSVGGIDIQILGIGSNGHIGFNEPSSSFASRTRVKTLTKETIKANKHYFRDGEEVPRYCLTMGIGTIMEAKTILLLAFGKNKEDAVVNSIEGPVTASVPASVLQLHPDVKIILDQEAASRLKRKDYYHWVYNKKKGIERYTKKLKSS